ncbi:cache domain-containing protein, partial [Luteimonas sp. Y-2-2-4F]
MSLKHTLGSALADLPLKRKFLLQTALVAVGIVALAVVAARIQFLDLNETRQAGLRSETEMALGVVEDFAGRVAAGELDEAAAQAAALRALSAMQASGGVDYFFVFDQGPTMLMHPRQPELVGQALGEVRDPDGKALFSDLVAAARGGGGFVDFVWAKPGADAPVRKTAYAQLYAPWGWIVSTGVYLDDTQAQALKFTVVMTAVGGLLVLLMLGLGWLIGDSVLRPVGQALAAIQGVSRGDLGIGEVRHGKDEVGQMLEATGTMMRMLERFSGETRRMIRLHEGEDIGHRMPEDFPGVYGELARGINTMMFEHLTAIQDAMAVLDRYANGDLSQDARRLPGTRAFLHEAMDAAKASLLAINGEIRRLAQAAAEGDFGVRGDEARFQDDFLAMVRGLNAMMRASDTNLAQLSALLRALAEGDLSHRMDGQFHGVFATMRDDANRTAEQLTRIVGRIQAASGAIDTAAGEIASGNNDLSRRTEQQAASLE